MKATLSERLLGTSGLNIIRWSRPGSNVSELCGWRTSEEESVPRAVGVDEIKLLFMLNNAACTAKAAHMASMRCQTDLPQG